jgi:hippurate hydrolase
MGATASVEYVSGYPAVMNWDEPTALAAKVAASVAGDDQVDAAAAPVMGSEDFAYMLERIPGCYVFIGNGAGDGACMIHNPGYDFNDAILPLGASYWVRLAEAFFDRDAA